MQATASMVGLTLALLAAFRTGSGYTDVKTGAAKVCSEAVEYLGLAVAKHDGLLALSELNMSFKAPLRRLGEGCALVSGHKRLQI